MAKVVTDNQYYTAIANAIRALTGSSDTYTPAQMAPAIIGYIAGVDLSDVESYFVTEVVNAMKYVKELGTTNWVHHIITTDNHFTKNYGHSTAIVKAMQDSGYFSKVINLGDVSDTGDEADYTMAIANYGQFNGDMLFAIGNHDVQVSGYETVFYNAFLSEDTDLVFEEGGSTKFNYYWDDTTHHIRYIVYNYTSASNGATYAVDRIKDAPSGYAVLAMCHYKDKINSTSLVPIIGHQLKFIGHINGHYHVDAQASQYGNQFVNTSLSNDGWTNDNANYVKEDGTSNSQAITIMSINLSTNKVKFRRIGKATTLGQSWEYTFVQGGTVEYWERGYNWGLGVLSAAANSYYCTKMYPAVDGEGNAITYRIYSKTGTLTNIYVIGMNADGDFVTNQRLSAPVEAIWNRIGFVTKYGITNHFTTPVVSYLWSINSDGNIASVDDIVITTDPVTLGVSFADVTWETGYYLNSSGANTEDADDATSLPFDILPNTQYRFYTDDADFSTNFMWAYLYSDKSTNAKNSCLPAFATGGRKGSSNTGTTEITFTTPADAKYCRMSVRGLATVENFANKCHLEVVTA